MKEARITLDRDEIDEILPEHLGGMFPTLEIVSILGLSYSDITVTLRKPVNIAPALDVTAEEPPYLMPAEIPF